MEKLRTKNFVLLALALALAGGSVGCGDDDDDSTTDVDAGDAGGNAGSSGKGSSGSGGKGSSGTGGKGSAGEVGDDDGGAGTSGSGGSGSSSDTCPAIKDREETLVDSEIKADTKWSCDKLYILTDLIFITGDSTLTVEAGTVVQGDSGSALISTRGSKLVTEGTKDAPVVFTSSADVGSRVGGDWGGVVMLGSATINVTGGENRVEGIEATDDRGLYGGDADEGSCGSLKYTRIEYGGFELSIDNELNGLTLGGCGSDTSISYVQVHRGNDDAIEVFGGAPQLDHIVMTGNADDGLDADLGNQVKVQFLVLQQDPIAADSAFEWNNQTDGDVDADPRSMPTVYNATLIGTNDAAGVQNGMVLRGGTAGIIRNSIITGFPVSGVDVREVSTVAGTDVDPLILTVENSLFFDNGPNGDTFEIEPTDGTTNDDDGAFVEEDFFTDAARHNVFDEDPKLGDAFSLTAPDFVPAASSPAKDGAATPPNDGFFDTKAKYMGAFEPGGDDWTEGWTTHAKN
jgi:hypothetical protein